MEGEDGKDDPVALRKQLGKLFDRISELENQQTSAPAPATEVTPPARKMSAEVAAETPSTKPEKPKNRAQRRAAPEPKPPVDPLATEIEALRKQFEKQARIIDQHQKPDPREAELLKLKEMVKKQAEVIQSFANTGQPSQPVESKAPNPNPSKPAANKPEPSSSNHNAADDDDTKAVDAWIDDQAIVMPDGTKAPQMQYRLCL